MTALTLAEIVAEARRLEKAIENERRNLATGQAESFALGRRCFDYSAFSELHFPRLLAVAEAAEVVDRLTEEMERLTDEPCTEGETRQCPRCDALGATDAQLTIAEAALRAAVRGER